MNIPKKVKIGAIVYKVVIVDKINDRGDLGETTHSKATIKILAGNKKTMEATFLHEILHAFNCISTEDFVETTSHRLHSFIEDNPNIFK